MGEASESQPVRDLFDRVVDAPVGEREALLSQAESEGVSPEVIERVRRLLAMADSGDGASLSGDPTGPQRRAVERLAAAERIDQIGPYKVVGVLGEGGMGTVYEATQAKPSRTVALKVIRPGLATPAMLARFEHEAEVLGRLQHPGIAQIFEAGTFESAAGPRPFFAMELVRGVPVTLYAQERKLGTRDRLELIAKVCEAVNHAHQKGIVHRDLKPANILVDDQGQPKILDFGVARLTDSDVQTTTLHTDIGQLIGTVPYMSPEQAGGDPTTIDTRSDVYALGVVAYELLTGRLPYDLANKMVHEAARVVREEDPRRLSTLDRTFRGDVETVIGKALEKDKDRRYQSALDFASDIRRYLRDEPIAARPAGTWYQLVKFSRRNKGLVAGVVAAFLVLLTGIAATSLALKRAIVAEGSAQTAAIAERRQRQLAEQTIGFWQTIMNQAARRYGGASATIRVALDLAAADSLTKATENDEAAAAARLHVIGQAYANLEQYEVAVRHLNQAVSLYKNSLGAAHVLTRTAVWDAATARWGLVQSAALPEMQIALSALLEVSKDSDPANWERMASLAALLGASGESDAARKWYDRLQAARAAAGDPEASRYAAQALMARAQMAATPQESVERWREARDRLEQLFGPEHIETVEAWRLLCFTLSYTSREPEAIEEYKRLLPAARSVYSDPNITLADTIKEYAGCLVVVRRATEADALAMEAVAMYQKLGEQCNPVRSADILRGLAHMHDQLGNPQRAEEIRTMLRQIEQDCAKGR